MSCKALIISLQDLELYCNVSEAVESNEVDVKTDLMQLKYIEPLLGTDLFDELLEQIDLGTVTVLNQSLIDKIVPALSWLVYSQMIPHGNIKSTAAGFIKNTDENFTLADKEELGSMAKLAYGNWQVYENKLIQYLSKNKADYPLWDDYNCREKGIAGYSISAIGGRQNIKHRFNVHYPSRFK